MDPCFQDSVRPPPQPVTSGPKHHFFGYYDKCPWDATGRYLLAHETAFMGRPPEPADEAVVGLIDTREGNAWRPFAGTTAWHWQLGSELQWVPGETARRTVHNEREGNRFVSVLTDVDTGEQGRLPRPVYALRPGGRSALSVNFARLGEMRPGYGYVGVPDPGREVAHPEDDGVYRMDLDTGRSELVLSLQRAAALNPRADMEEAKHWFNHVQINTDGSRFAALHRWRGPETGKGRRTRLLTCAFDGTGLRIVADDGKVSHYDWRDPHHILAWARQEDVGERYFLFDERTGGCEVVGDGILNCNGHCSFSPDRRRILTDTYPDGDDMRHLLLYRPEDRRCIEIGEFFSPPELSGPVRCDLHPRWSRNGDLVCIDSAHERTRQIYTIAVSDLID